MWQALRRAQAKTRSPEARLRGGGSLDRWKGWEGFPGDKEQWEPDLPAGLCLLVLGCQLPSSLSFPLGLGLKLINNSDFQKGARRLSVSNDDNYNCILSPPCH